jgi:hypothetical protein
MTALEDKLHSERETRPPTFRVSIANVERLARVDLVSGTVYLTAAQLRGAAEAFLEMASQLELEAEESAK